MSIPLCNPFAKAAALLLPLSIVPCLAVADIVFSAKVAGPVSNIYTLDDSYELHRLTDNIHWRDIEPDIAADDTVVFASNRTDETGVDLERRSENFNIYLVAAGKKPRPIVTSARQDLKPRFSPDGKKVAFLRRGGDGVQLGLAARDGSSERELLSADDIFDYTWSPDGERVAVTLRRGEKFLLGTLGIATGDSSPAAVEILESSDGTPPVNLSWSPDGRHLAYVRHPFDGGSRSLWLRDLASGGERRISADGVEVQAAPSWSRDGQRLLFAALVDYSFHYDEQAHQKVYRGGMQLFSADIRGGSRQLTDGKALHRAPLFHAGENRIAFLHGQTLDARSLALGSMDLESGEVRQLYDGVAQRSALRAN
ncbi:TolB family protein [Microbulbifer halophilus]|uniref:TolB family protein n=1 Tax=Microbulbifer halophilus TaxID=453963 RepID=A0ABW5EGP0_9GAMM|nr:hypothetical protein [Microbulbifer halophilus]MCW8128000.1 hypothetical protein [Microbulbifer halophilus]